MKTGYAQITAITGCFKSTIFCDNVNLTSTSFSEENQVLTVGIYQLRTLYERKSPRSTAWMVSIAAHMLINSFTAKKNWFFTSTTHMLNAHNALPYPVRCIVILVILSLCQPVFSYTMLCSQTHDIWGYVQMSRSLTVLQQTTPLTFRIGSVRWNIEIL